MVELLPEPVAPQTRRIPSFASASFRTVAGTISAGGEVEQDVVSDVSNFGVTLDGTERDSHSFFLEDRYSKALGEGSSIELSLGVREVRTQRLIPLFIELIGVAVEVDRDDFLHG